MQARFADATVSMRDVDAPVRSLQGSLTVRNTLVAAADLHGQWLGGPLEVVIRPDGHNASTLSATGTAAAAQLKPFLPSAVKVSGATQWRLGDASSTATRATRSASPACASNRICAAWASRCPSRSARARANSGRSRSRWKSDGDDAVLARSWLGDVRAIVRVARSDGGWSLDRGGIRADGNAPALPNHRGLRIEGTVERFVLDDWLALKGDGSGDGSGGGKPLSDYLQAANVRVGTFEFAAIDGPTCAACCRRRRPAGASMSTVPVRRDRS